MNFVPRNYCLINLFCVELLTAGTNNFGWNQFGNNFKEEGSSTNCNDKEIEKYIIPGQTIEPGVAKEHGSNVLNLHVVPAFKNAYLQTFENSPYEKGAS